MNGIWMSFSGGCMLIKKRIFKNARKEPSAFRILL
jgi:hypothetical protein